MPYAKKEELPDAVKALPEHAQEIWMAAFNSAWEQYKGDEERCFAVAWAAVKNKYKKEGENWKQYKGDWVPLEHGVGDSTLRVGDSTLRVGDSTLREGLEGWVEIFRTGEHTDSAGNIKKWTEEDLDQITARYNPAEHEAPVVIGHPVGNAPAFGWVEAVRREGQFLYAKFKNLVPEFVDMVKKGLFKKRSMSVYQDGTLRHIGFLGAMPPAVKGLADIKFEAEKKAITIEFEQKRCRHLNEDDTFKGGFDGCVEHMMSCEGLREENARRLCAYIGRKAGKIESAESKQKGGMKMNFKEWLKGIFTKAVDAMPDGDLQPPAPQTFSEAEVRAREAEAVKRAKEEKDREFAEQKKREAKERRAGEVKSFCEMLLKEGKIIPAWMKSGLQEFLTSLDGEESLEFDEKKEKASRLEWMKNFLSKLPEVVNFREIAKRDEAFSGNAGEKLNQLVREKMEKKKDLSYNQAFSEVQIENPDLAREYQEEIRPTKK